MNDILQRGYYEYPLRSYDVDWFVNKVIKLENKTAFHFKNTKKDIIMTQENKEYFVNINICRFCEKISSDKVRNHCHLTGKNRGPAHSKCKINATQDESNIIPFTFHKFSSYDFHMFF